MRTGTFTMTPVPQLLLFALHMSQIKMNCMQQTSATFRYKVETKDGWAYHVGDDADERMTAAAQKRDVHLTSKSRPLEPEDFQKFDFIVGMDDENIKAIKKAAAHWKDNLKKTLFLRTGKRRSARRGIVPKGHLILFLARLLCNHDNHYMTAV